MDKGVERIHKERSLWANSKIACQTKSSLSNVQSCDSGTAGILYSYQSLSAYILPGTLHIVLLFIVTV